MAKFATIKPLVGKLPSRFGYAPGNERERSRYRDQTQAWRIALLALPTRVAGYIRGASRDKPPRSDENGVFGGMSCFSLNVFKKRLRSFMIRHSRRFRESDGGRAILGFYKEIHGKPLNVDNPTRFTELLFCRMLDLNRHGNPLFTRLADKFLAREFVASRIGPDYLVPVIWHGDDPERIPFDDLPAKYIIKANHGAGGHIIVDGPSDRAATIKQMRKSLSRNYYWGRREYQYFDIVPKILIERLLDDGHEYGPRVYRVFCFGSRPEVVQISDSILSLHAFFDLEWNKLDIKYRTTHYHDVDIPKPAVLEQLFELSSRLSEGIDFVRVDFYIVESHIYFSEMTFTPEAGQLKFVDDKWDCELGGLWSAARCRATPQIAM